MRLKVLSINTDKFDRNDKTHGDILERRIIEASQFQDDRYHCYRIVVESSAEQFGLLNSNNEIDSLADEMAKSNSKLLKCRFLMVDTKSKIAMYDGSINDVKEILSELFNINHKQIENIVSVEEFYKLKTLTITTIPKGQFGLTDEEMMIAESERKWHNLFVDTGDINKISYKINLVKEGAVIKQDKFKEVYEKHQDGLQTITASGFDKNGTEIKLSSSISKEVTILKGNTGWYERINLELSSFLEAILAEVRFI